MNLSERLDAARAKRNRGDAPELGHSSLDLRVLSDSRVYDGTHLRTGEPMTEERWLELQRENPGLPAWNPDRAHDDFSTAWSVDFTDPTLDAVAPQALSAEDPTPATAPEEGQVVSLDDHRDEPEIALPAWAEGVTVYDAPTDLSPAPSAGSRSCPTCGGDSEVVHVDLLADEARLECQVCGLLWHDRVKTAYEPRQT